MSPRRQLRSALVLALVLLAGCARALPPLRAPIDPEVHRARMAELVAIAADPKRARQLLLDSSMIAGLRRAQEIR